jgi:hypothetical protein
MEFQAQAQETRIECKDDEESENEDGKKSKMLSSRTWNFKRRRKKRGLRVQR